MTDMQALPRKQALQSEFTAVIPILERLLLRPVRGQTRPLE